MVVLTALGRTADGGEGVPVGVVLNAAPEGGHANSPDGVGQMGASVELTSLHVATIIMACLIMYIKVSK